MLQGTYNPSLVLLSFVVAALASYTTLKLSERATAAGAAAPWWIAGGGVAMGVGIWSMHFLGMLAFRLPIPLGYDVSVTILSLLLPIIASAGGLWLVSRPQLPIRHLLLGALLFGLAINAMHYTGMAAMLMQPGIVYDVKLFLASLAIAFTAAGASLWIAFKLRRNQPNVGLLRMLAAAAMGFAIAGMHYTGMAAANFPVGSICGAAAGGVSNNVLAVLVILGTLGVLAIALVTAVYDARLEARSEVLAISEASAAERKVLLEREQSARAEAERMSRMKDEFLAMVSHELRTPLNAIVGWVQLLQLNSSDPVRLAQGLEVVGRNAEAQVRIINDLLEMNRVASNKIELHLSDVDAVLLARTAVESAAPAASSEGIQLSCHTVDMALVRGDAERLQQVLSNLLSNAIKFTLPGGAVTVNVTRRDASVQIAVTDTGIGISPEFLPFVFEQFRQADSTVTRSYRGLGLGLSIVKHLVELHGGTVFAESRGLGQGSTFTVRLPALPAAGNANQAVAGAPATHRFAANALAGHRFLIVEDEDDTREVLRQALVDHGASVLLASRASDGLRLVQQVEFDAIVSDLGMPDIDGVQFIKQVRALPGQPGNTPAIVVTAFARAEDRERALAAGFQAYLAKPLRPADLVAVLIDLMGARADQGQGD
ncbi:MAG: hypothetical protein JWP36_854 [Paucimonas sp.]|nr:hypothetical protein [Paucimonas sp.]